jgi:hypothetical protein
MDPIPFLYGLAVAAMLACVWLSRSPVLQKTGLLLMYAWALSNLAVDWLGFERAPLLVPSLDAIIAILIAITGYRSRSRLSLVVFGIYAIIGSIHVWALLTQMQETYTYYATLNLLFLSQLLILGGSGAWLALRSRAAGGHQRLGPYHPRRAHPG